MSHFVSGCDNSIWSRRPFTLDTALFRSVAARIRLSIPAAVLAFAWQAQAVTFTVSQAGPPTWTYTLTFAPLDNYSIFQGSTTITLSGLSGVTAATGPTSTDFDAGHSAINLAWTAQVLDGGTKVVWTHVGAGTGNEPLTNHVYGFSVTAANSANGTVSLATSGMSRDTDDPLPGGGSSLDITGTLAGPVTNVSPAPAPMSFILALLGLGCAAGYQARRLLAEQIRNRAQY